MVIMKPIAKEIWDKLDGNVFLSVDRAITFATDTQYDNILLDLHQLMLNIQSDLYNLVYNQINGNDETGGSA